MSLYKYKIQFSSVTQSCPTLCHPMDCSMPGFPVHHQLLELTQSHVHRVSDAIYHLVLCCPLLLPSSIFPSIRVFSSESVFRIRWPKYWSFSFSTSLSNEYSGLISFRTDWLDLLAVQGTLKSLLIEYVQSVSFVQSGLLDTQKPTHNRGYVKGGCLNYSTTISHHNNQPFFFFSSNTSKNPEKLRPDW